MGDIMKIKLICFTLFIMLVCVLNIVEARNNELPLWGKVIYLDAGHGGIDPGAIYKSFEEKDINLQISNLIEEMLVKKGAIVYQTRYGDYDLSVTNTINRKRSDLSRRVDIINDSKADMYLSIHLNSDLNNSYKGAQVFYDDINAENIVIAELFDKVFREKLYSERKLEKVKDLYMSRRIEIPGVLLELGFLSNANDRYRVTNELEQVKLSSFIVEVVTEYFD